MEGRQFNTTVEIAYAGGVLPSDSYEALVSAMCAAIVGEAVELSFACSQLDRSVATVAVALRADTPLGALTRLSTVLDDSLLATGLFEEFDVTGKTMRVSPRTATAGGLHVSARADWYLVQLLGTFGRLDKDAVEIGDAEAIDRQAQAAVAALETAGALSRDEALTWRTRFAGAYKRNTRSG
ncbi:MAG: hypothetical protein ACRDQA_18350 [Nocardioidaceae bacterium]